LKERDILQSSFYKIRRAAQLKKMLLDKLIDTQARKERRAFGKLQDNYRRFLADKTSLMSENVINHSLNILERIAEDNLKQCLKVHPGYETGLERLNKVF